MRLTTRILIGLLVATLCLAPIYRADQAEANQAEAREKISKEDWASFANMLTDIGKVSPPPHRYALFVGQGIIFGALFLWDIFALAPDNPDPNHGTVVSITPAKFTLSDANGPDAATTNAALITMGRIIDDSRGLKAALERCAGADLAGDADNIVLQRTSAAGFFVSLEQDLETFSSNLAAMATAVENTPAASNTITVASVLAQRDQIAEFGFPPAELAIFSEMNATPAEIQGALAESAAMTGESLGDLDLSLLGILTHGVSVIQRTIPEVVHPLLNLLPPTCNPLTSIGGTVELPTSGADLPPQSAEGSGFPFLIIAEAMAAFIALGLTGWYVRRGWMN